MCYIMSPRPSYVVPTSLSHGIKLVNPMFRGYAQQVGASTQQVTTPGITQHLDTVSRLLFLNCKPLCSYIFPKMTFIYIYKHQKV